MIRANTISINYEGKKILKDVSMQLSKGEICFLIGPSGAGKSTLLRCLAMIDIPEKGSLEVNSKKYSFSSKAKPKEFPYPEVSVVFQQLFLWPHLSNKENILLSQGKKIPDRFHELVDLFQMDQFLAKFPNESSIGQRQRVALARALINEPEYLLLDEITASLDIEQVGILATYLKKLKLEGIGILFITHQLGVVTKYADRIIFMDNGMLIEEGGTNILKNPKSNRLKSFIEHII